MLRNIFNLLIIILEQNDLTHINFYVKTYFLTTENAYCVIKMRIVTIIAGTVSYNYFKK